MAERTLGEIIEAAVTNEPVTEREMRLAILAMEGLMTFDHMAFSKLREAEVEKKRPILSYSAEWQHSEAWRRRNMAMTGTPSKWLGPDRDPEKVEFRQQRKAAQHLFDSIADRAEARRAKS